MEALLILGGLLLVLAGLVWLVVLAFGTSLLWGLGSLIPPITLAFLFSHWRVARKALLLSALGIIPLVVGLVLLATQDSQRFAAILELRWLEPAAEQPAAENIQLRGTLHGEVFKPQQLELQDDLLILREGQDFFAQREIRIRLPRPVTGPLVVDVLPEDQGAGLPEVEISWLLPGQELPEARRLSRGYTLHLNLRPQALNRLAGDFHLVLPPRYDTTLSGNIEVLRSGLRLRNGRIDYRHDSRDTLAEVVSQYLAQRFAGSEVQLQSLPPVRFPASTLTLNIGVQVDGKTRSLPLKLVKDEKQGWRVASAPAAAKVVQPVDAEPQAAPVRDDGRFSLILLVSEPERYIGRTLKISLVRGGTAEGVFTGMVEDGLIRLQRNLRGADAAVFLFHPDDIAFVELVQR